MAAENKKQFIRIRGANENNLKNLSVDIPRDKFVVLTGLSGSGKSSLAFDTIYAEGQRRYMESLSSYARQFLGQMEKPDVESIEGLPPAISIDQKSTNRNPRSTVGTVTEIYDYFRLLYARVGIPHCPKCGKVIAKQTVDQMVDQIMELPERTRIQLLAPVVRGRKGTHAKLLDQARRSGYVRAEIDGNVYELSEEITLDKNIKHTIAIIVDRLIVKPGIEKRLTDSLETVLNLADGLAVVDTMDGNYMNFSQSFSCPDCGVSIDEIEPRSFSFNNPFGACPECLGLGYKMEFDPDLMIPDKSLSISEGAIVVMGWQSCTDKSSFTNAILNALCREYGFDLDTPFKDYPKKIQDIILYGTGGHSHALSGSSGSSEWHAGKGIRLQKSGCHDVQISWQNAVNRIQNLIRNDRYFKPEVKDEPQDSVEIPINEPEKIAEKPLLTLENYRITDDTLGEAGPKAKFRMNMDAIYVLKILENESRNATPEEQETLAKYVGWWRLN